MFWSKDKRQKIWLLQYLIFCKAYSHHMFICLVDLRLNILIIYILGIKRFENSMAQPRPFIRKITDLVENNFRG